MGIAAAVSHEDLVFLSADGVVDDGLVAAGVVDLAGRSGRVVEVQLAWRLGEEAGVTHVGAESEWLGESPGARDQEAEEENCGNIFHLDYKRR